MDKIFKNIVFLFFAAIFFSCSEKPQSTSGIKKQELFSTLKKDTSVKYAKRFAVYENKTCKVLYLFGRVNINDTSATYILLKDTSVKVQESENTFVLEKGCHKIASLSSVYTSMLCGLGEINHIAAIENIDYYTNPEVLYKYEKMALPELAKNPEMDVEKTILLDPDIVFTFGMGEGKGVNEKILRAKIPVVVTVDHLEESPLARAEWIKFFACFVNKEAKADSVFSGVEKEYFALKDLAATAKTHPKVLTEIKYGEIWYVPGGKSFAATFIHDAGGDYPWASDKNTGSLHLSFEDVLVKAGDAEFWLNLSLLKSKEELKAAEARYSEFKVFKLGNLYNNTKNTNAKGYSDYWETGIMYPNRVLSDLILIFHPELKSQIPQGLYYYKRLE